MSCSELALAAGVPLAGTATRADRWLVLEHPGPWGRDAVADSELPPALEETLLEYDARVMLARRPGRRATPGVTAFVARTTEAGGDLRRIELARIEDAASIDPEHDGDVVDGPLVLVCVHRRRDACCGRLGVPVFNALRPHLPPDRLWRSSHHGGHRFAANVLALPWGVQLGRVTPGEASAVAAALAQGRIPLDHYRGRTLHAPAVQAADAAVRTETGADRVADVRLVAHEGSIVRLRTSKGMVDVEITERRGAELPPSCGAEPEASSTFVARIVSITG